ncbi:putative ribonuclease H-like domain-containing protein [Tanacetum coccineum]
MLRILFPLHTLLTNPAFHRTNFLPASPGNTSPNFSLALSPFYDDLYIKVMQAYDATDNELPIPPQAPIAPPTILPPSPVLSLSSMFDSRHFFPPEKISPPKDAETPVESPIPISPSSSVGSSSPMPPKRTSTSAAPSMTQAAIRQLVANSVAAALEAQAATNLRYMLKNGKRIEMKPVKGAGFNLGGKCCFEGIRVKVWVVANFGPSKVKWSQFKPSGDNEKKVTKEPGKEGGDPSNKNNSVNSTNDINTASDGNGTNNVNTVSSTVNTVGIEVNAVSSNTSIKLPNDQNMPELEDILYSDDYEEVGAEADINNLNTFMHVIPIPTTRIHKDHPVEKIIGDLNSTPQTRRMTKNLEKHEAIQDELLQFKLQKVWILVDLPNGKRPICTKWVYKNKKDGRGIMIKNKARLVAQVYTQEEGIDYDEVFALVARIEAIRRFLAYASFKDFMVYQMDVKSAFLYGKIEEEVYVCQPSGFEDLNFPNRVYKVEKALYGLHQAPKAWYETLSTYLLDNGFQRGKIDKTLFIRRDKGDILLVQVYVDDIIFGSTKKSLCTEFEKMMHKKFQMSSIGELTFFLGLQVKKVIAGEDGLFIIQDME